MSLKLLAVAAIASAATTAFAGLFGGFTPAHHPDAKITGDYIEARTASVFCGACHYNGELMTTGHDALLAWKFDGGTYRGVSLNGVRAFADVSCAENLSLHDTAHKTQLVIDSSATSEQASAVAALIQEKCGELGEISQIISAPVSFSHTDAGYEVDTPGFAHLNVNYRTDNSCCVMPGLVWYTPLSPIDHRMVGFTESAGYSGNMTPPWSREGEDSAFYGAIAF
jgi:hypothetical protein